MNVVIVALSALKLGLYAPAGPAFPIMPYVGAELVAPKDRQPGLELGFSAEPVKRDSPFVVNGHQGTRYAYMGTAMLGLSWSYHKDLTLNAGVRHRIPDGFTGPYVGASFRLGSIKKQGD